MTQENSKNQIVGSKYRITILTPQLIRLEYQEQGIFQDKATQIIMNRKFEPCDYDLEESEQELKLMTTHISLTYNKQPFSCQGLCIKVKGDLTNYQSVYHYGDEIEDLKGTARTLDNTDGEIPLDRGILSRNGFSVLDDSHSFFFDSSENLCSPIEEHIDFYFFGYGRDYLTALRDYYHLTGASPMLPRYALGNWWSRYYPYTQTEYEELINTFEKKRIPLSVAVIDMDWHLVDIPHQYGSGWTGYTWNDKLFPDYHKLLDWLHKKHLKVTLNDHPAEGVRGFECMYKDMARTLGYDSEKEIPIEFDLTDKKFVKASFDYIYHPYENDGVDFWWLDWQQGEVSKVEGLDPLWLLNHYHYEDSKRNGRRGLILSRYAGPGSHRYPIGFSGDTVMSWKALEFQPYFTANASNIGYSWWSHDIGGHMLGIRSDELTLRWIQFGVFSPIMRLHSSASPFIRKEPWSTRKETERSITFFMQLRHRMIPYLYTMNARCHFEGIPLMMPMYYQYPEEMNAYQVKNEYFFGSELIVCPITSPQNRKLRIAASSMWLPKGKFIDCFNGMVYDGGRMIRMYRELEQIPVLAKAGAIVPMMELTKEVNDTTNPEILDLYIFAGADGEFTLYEDDGISFDYENHKDARTSMKYYHQQGIFLIHEVEGSKDLIPKERSYRLHLKGFTRCDKIEVFGEAIPFTYQSEKNEYITKRYQISASSSAEFKIYGDLTIKENNVVSRIFHLLDYAEIETRLKEDIFYTIEKDSSAQCLTSLMQLNIGTELFQAISEIILATKYNN